jgi:hypothetical protein
VSLERAVSEELRRPLPERLNAAQARGFADYFTTAKYASENAAAARERRAEKVFEGLGEAGGVPGESRAKRLRRASLRTPR